MDWRSTMHANGFQTIFPTQTFPLYTMWSQSEIGYVYQYILDLGTGNESNGGMLQYWTDGMMAGNDWKWMELLEMACNGLT